MEGSALPVSVLLDTGEIKRFVGVAWRGQGKEFEQEAAEVEEMKNSALSASSC